MYESVGENSGNEIYGMSYHLSFHLSELTHTEDSHELNMNCCLKNKTYTSTSSYSQVSINLAVKDSETSCYFAGIVTSTKCFGELTGCRRMMSQSADWTARGISYTGSNSNSQLNTQMLRKSLHTYPLETIKCFSSPSLALSISGLSKLRICLTLALLCTLACHYLTTVSIVTDHSTAAFLLTENYLNKCFGTMRTNAMAVIQEPLFSASKLLIF